LNYKKNELELYLFNISRMNEIMEQSSQYKDLVEFLAKHNAKNFKEKEFTHTRIGDEKLNIYGGSYVIEEDELNVFNKLYYDHIFVQKKKEYLTERQLKKEGPILVDFDFRYDYDVSTRRHTKSHIEDMLLLYLEELKEYFLFEENKQFEVFIFEKPNVNRVKDDNITKDGIHMIIGIQMDHTMQIMLREKILKKLPEIWDLPFTNSWDKILDDGISKGSTNWQLYGSRKPGNEAYELKYNYLILYDKSDGEFMIDEKTIEDFDMKQNFWKLTVRNNKNPVFEINPKIVDEYNKRLQNAGGTRIKRPISRSKMNILIDENDDDISISLSDITNKEILSRAVEKMLKEFNGPNDYYKKETHYYTQILPEKYYNPGSHLLNRQVAFALKHTDNRLFLSWVMLRSKAIDFDYSTIPKLYHDWTKYFNITNSQGEGFITKKSIMYWAKQDNFEEYEKVKKNTIDYFIEETIKTKTEYDEAVVLYHMFKDKFVCASIENKIWYKFVNHRWVIDKGLKLRNTISNELYSIYEAKRESLQNDMTQYESTDPRHEKIKKDIGSVCELMIKSKKTHDKNNIFREAMELFYDEDFISNMDTNKYLLCFNNGVIDFKTKEFRHGYPQDYITKSTKIDYREYNPNDQEMLKIGNELIVFMQKLFPIESVNRYMWDHLASCLIGINKTQTFNVYHGSGSNGKSMLADLMSKTLGEYKGTVPIQLVTDKRTQVGGVSPEIPKLKGIRYAVMQEPTKGVKLNEGIMKEFTSGTDPIGGRALWGDYETFLPQFKLVVCTNNLFDIESNDDGTWRRIRKIDFVSKFVNENDNTDYGTPYVYKKDLTLEDRIPILAPVFAAMLVKRAFETNGEVVDSDVVLEASNKYRNGQDHIAAFVNERIMKTDNQKDKIGKRGLSEDFKHWFSQEQGGKKMPKGEELFAYMDKKFGPHKSTGWHGITFIQPEPVDELEEFVVY